jgi:hypothetical protein
MAATPFQSAATLTIAPGFDEWGLEIAIVLLDGSEILPNDL